MRNPCGEVSCAQACGQPACGSRPCRAPSSASTWHATYERSSRAFWPCSSLIITAVAGNFPPLSGAVLCRPVILLLYRYPADGDGARKPQIITIKLDTCPQCVFVFRPHLPGIWGLG